MKYKLKKFNELLKATSGFSEKMLRNHFNLYEGYVDNTNKLIDKLNSYSKKGKVSDPEYAELKRRFGWEFNGMRLHEYYFGNMAKRKREMDEKSNIYDKIREDFGSYDKWERDFKNSGMMRGIGWVVLYCDSHNDRLFNVWIGEHDIGNLVSAEPILVMDVFEHSYLPDYGLKKADYINAFFNVIDWRVIEERFDNA